MASAKEAKKWAPEHLKGIIEALYTPYMGKDGDEIDYDSIRKAIEYLLKDMHRAGIYVCGTVGEFTTLTKEERKMTAEVAIKEINRVNPKAIQIVHTGCLSAKDTVELTNHAKATGADMAIILTPCFEVFGAGGVFDYFKYIAERTDIALAVYNSPATGFVLSPEAIANLYKKIPAVCAVKNALFQPRTSIDLRLLVPEMVIYESELLATCSQGLIKQGFTNPVLMGTTAYLFEKPGKMIFSEYWNLAMQGKFTEAINHYYASGLEELSRAKRITHTIPGTGSFGHWASGNKYMASLLGMPIGDYPHSRPPQIPLPEASKHIIHDIYAKLGFI